MTPTGGSDFLNGPIASRHLTDAVMSPGGGGGAADSCCWMIVATTNCTMDAGAAEKVQSSVDCCWMILATTNCTLDSFSQPQRGGTQIPRSPAEIPGESDCCWWLTVSTGGCCP